MYVANSNTPFNLGFFFSLVPIIFVGIMQTPSRSLGFRWFLASWSPKASSSLLAVSISSLSNLLRQSIYPDAGLLHAFRSLLGNTCRCAPPWRTLSRSASVQLHPFSHAYATTDPLSTLSPPASRTSVRCNNRTGKKQTNDDKMTANP